MTERKYGLLLLDEDYKDFKPGKTRLKYATVFEASVSLSKMFTMALVFTGLFACQFAFLLPEMQTMTALEQNGIVTDATITWCEMAQVYRGSYTPHIYYTYQLEDTVYKSDEQIRAGGGLKCDAYPAGMNVAIVYLPAAPDITRLLLDKNINPAYSGWAVLGGGFVGFLMLACWLLLLDWIRGWFKWRRFNKYALLIEGKLLDAHYEKRRWSSVWVLSYQYENPQGMLQTRTYKWHYHAYPRIIPRAEKAVRILYVNEKLQLLL